MVPVAMLLVALPAGLFAHTARQAVTLTAAVFAALLIAQSVVVATASSDGLGGPYWLVQVASLVGGALLLALGLRWRARRALS